MKEKEQKSMKTLGKLLGTFAILAVFFWLTTRFGYVLSHTLYWQDSYHLQFLEPIDRYFGIHSCEELQAGDVFIIGLSLLLSSWLCGLALWGWTRWRGKSRTGDRR